MRLFTALLSFTLCVVVHAGETTTPIRHVVVLFQENNSFDHYFATYPQALNPPGEPAFHAAPDTPAVNGLSTALLQHNRNLAKPFRIERRDSVTFSNSHEILNEQRAYHAGLVDAFVENTGSPQNPAQVMGYFDGNTVTALWNYAQHFAMSDNFFGTTFGPSSIGAINLVSGQTAGASSNGKSTVIDHGRLIVNKGIFVSNSDPEFDDCSHLGMAQVRLSGKNIGDLLNSGNVSWGWFQGGFRPSAMIDGRAVCGRNHPNSWGAPMADYLPHHQPFQYYASTANPHHLPPSSQKLIGQQDQANHQYDLQDFWDAAVAGNLPAVSFLKAPASQDGHSGYSNPLAEQQYLVETINRLQKLRQWRDMAIIIAYDDSDGWYDHVMPTIANAAGDADIDSCGKSAGNEAQGRCGYGPRLPFLLISPYSRHNFVDHSLLDQSSIIRFIEDNWALGRIGGGSFDEKAGSLSNLFDFSKKMPPTRLILDPASGLPDSSGN